jgi:hypothetical protein
MNSSLTFLYIGDIPGSPLKKRGGSLYGSKRPHHPAQGGLERAPAAVHQDQKAVVGGQGDFRPLAGRSRECFGGQHRKPGVRTLPVHAPPRQGGTRSGDQARTHCRTWTRHRHPWRDHGRAVQRAPARMAELSHGCSRLVRWRLQRRRFPAARTNRSDPRVLGLPWPAMGAGRAAPPQLEYLRVHDGAGSERQAG